MSTLGKLRPRAIGAPVYEKWSDNFGYCARAGITLRSIASTNLVHWFQEITSSVLVGTLTGIMILPWGYVQSNPHYSKRIPSSIGPLFLMSEMLIRFTSIQGRMNVLSLFRRRASNEMKMHTHLEYSPRETNNSCTQSQSHKSDTVPDRIGGTHLCQRI
jgi:hypothetical protein